MIKLLFALVPLLLYHVQARDCYASCLEIPQEADKPTCRSNCDTKIIIVICVTVVAGLLFIACIYCCLKDRDLECVYRKRQRFALKYNNVDENKMPKQLFDKEKQEFINCIKKSSKVNILSFRTTEKEYPIQINSIEFTPVGDFIESIKIQGKDKFQEWVAQGYFLCNSDGIFVWFLREYENGEVVEAEGITTLTLFEGVKETIFSYRGMWMCEGDEKKKDIGGSWHLLLKVLNVDNSLQQIRTQEYIK